VQPVKPVNPLRPVSGCGAAVIAVSLGPLIQGEILSDEMLRMQVMVVIVSQVAIA
jgi:hypothetical protein